MGAVVEVVVSNSNRPPVVVAVADDDVVYYCNGWRLELKGKARKTGFCAKKQISVKPVLRGHSLH